MATGGASTMEFTTDYETSSVTIDEITSSTDGSKDTSTFSYSSPSTTGSTPSTYFTTEQWWRTTYNTWTSTTYNPPTYPESTSNGTFIIIVIIILSLSLLFGLYLGKNSIYKIILYITYRNL